MAAAAPPQPPVYAQTGPDQQPGPWQQPPPGYGMAPAPVWQASPQGPPVQAPPAPPPQYAPPQQYATQQYPPQQYAPPQQQYAPPPPPQQQYAPPQQRPPMPPPPGPAAWQQPEPKAGPPLWLMTLGVAAGLLVIIGGIWYFLNSSDSGSSTTTAQKTAATGSSTAGASQSGASNPLQKAVEVVGLRMVTENQKPVVKFVVVNHSGAEIDDLAANVTLLAGTSKSDEDSVGTFSFKVNMLGPNDVKELSAPLKTKLKMYELPDWQNTTAEVDVTSPAAQ